MSIPGLPGWGTLTQPRGESTPFFQRLSDPELAGIQMNPDELIEIDPLFA